MKEVYFKTESGVEGTIVFNKPGELQTKGAATLVVGDKQTADFAFISENAVELVAHFLRSEDTDFAVGITGASAITKAVKDEASNMGHSLMSVVFKDTGNIMPLGELAPNYVPEISSLLMASFQPQSEKQVINAVTTVTGFELLGRIVEIKLNA